MSHLFEDAPAEFTVSAIFVGCGLSCVSDWTRSAVRAVSQDPKEGGDQFSASYLPYCGVEKSANLPGTIVPVCH